MDVEYDEHGHGKCTFVVAASWPGQGAPRLLLEKRSSVRTFSNMTRWYSRSAAPWATQNNGSIAAPDPTRSPSIAMREHINRMIPFTMATRQGGGTVRRAGGAAAAAKESRPVRCTFFGLPVVVQNGRVAVHQMVEVQIHQLPIQAKHGRERGRCEHTHRGIERTKKGGAG